MDWLAGSRLHLVDVAVTRGLTYVPIYLLGFSEAPLFAYVAFVSIQATFIHANVRFRFGPLAWMLATPQFHHWHHGAEHEAVDKNFAVHLPVIDWLFGTFHLPKDRWPASVRPLSGREGPRWVCPAVRVSLPGPQSLGLPIGGRAPRSLAFRPLGQARGRHVGSIISAMTGTTVGHYEILEKLGEGGMGVVYKARDVLLNRTAALKFLPADSADADDKRRRFVQEAQAASALNHPNIVTIYEVGQADGRDFIAMELVQGQPLDEVIGRKALPLGRAIAYGIQIADALAAAHAAGIVHRDLKPGNVMVADSGLVKVLDFGLAKLVARASSGVRCHANDAGRQPQDRRGHDPRHRVLHVARTGGRQAGRSPLRHLLVRRAALRNAHRPARVPGRVDRLHAGGDSHGRARSAVRAKRLACPPSWSGSSRAVCERRRRSAGRASPTSGSRSKSSSRIWTPGSSPRSRSRRRRAAAALDSDRGGDARHGGGDRIRRVARAPVCAGA